jgi:thymidylate kinase
MTIIYLYGPDGSGKTTLAGALACDLKKHGFRVKRSWMRGSHTFISILSRFLSRFNSFKSECNTYYGIKVPKRMVKLWYFLEYISSMPVILLKFVVPSFLGYVIIADRYVVDLAVWVTLITGDDSFLGTIFAKHLVSLALRSRFRFFIVADLDELAKRSGEKTTKLSKQLKLYRSVDLKAYVIDTTENSPQESLREILEVLERSGMCKKT